MIGILPTLQAIQQAQAAGLDLLEVSPHADPPVCKILDYGKYRYELQKKRAEARKNQKTVDVKEVQLRPGINEHDFQVKLRAVQRFLAAGNKVKIVLRFRGREIAHHEIGVKLLGRIQENVADTAKVENQPRLEGRQMLLILAPENT